MVIWEESGVVPAVYDFAGSVTIVGVVENWKNKRRCIANTGNGVGKQEKKRVERAKIVGDYSSKERIR